LISEKRNKRYWETRKELRGKYKVVFNDAAFKHLAELLEEEKSDKNAQPTTEK